MLRVPKASALEFAEIVAPGPGGSSWTSALVLAVRWGFAMSVALVMVGALRALATEAERLPLLGDLSLIGLGVVQAAVVALAFTGFSRLWSDATLVVSTGVLLALFLLGQPLGPWEVGWWPTAAVVAVQCWVLAFGGPWRWWLGVSACVAYAGLRLVATLVSGESLRIGLAEVVSGLQLALMLVFGIRAFRKIAAHSERVDRQRREALWVEQRQHLAEAKSRDVVRFLHDDVIHTLRTLATPRGASPEYRVDMAHRTALRLSDSDTRPPTGEMGQLLDRLAALGPETGVHVTLTGRAPWVPSYVGDALVAAAAEAVRNVARHAGTDEARLHVEGREGGISVRIADEGAGLAGSSWGQGLRESVIGRMKDIGGAAVLHSGAAGTTVDLTWRPAGIETRVAALWREVRRALTGAVVPCLAGTVLMGLLVASEVRDPWLLLAGVALVTGAGAVSLSRDGYQLASWRVAVLLVVAVAALLINFQAVSSYTRNGYHLLLAGGVTPLLMIVVIHWPVRWAVPAVLGVWAVLIGLGTWRFGLDVITGPLFGALTAPVAVAALIGVKVLLTGMGRRILVAQDDTIRSRLRAGQAAERQDSRDDRLRRIRLQVQPLLDDVVSGRVAPGEPSVLRRARALESGVREEIRFEHPPEVFRTATAAARSRGWALETRLTEAQLAALEQTLVALLGALDHPSNGSGPAVLSAVDGAALVVEEPAADSVERWRRRTDLEVEEAGTWVRLTLRTTRLAPRPFPLGH